jgi:HAD superfamily hydrolase (TIGR01549 family)
VSELRAVVFDFDGVILESVDVKTRAFAALFADWPEHEDEIVGLHVENAGISRFEKFVRIYRDILRLPLTDAELARLGDDFAKLIRAEMQSCAFVPGARELLDELAKRYPLFIASGTPEAEMREIVDQRGLGSLFTGVYGSPAKKGAILRHISDEHGFATDELVFVGDALSDYEGAREAGVAFVARMAPDGVVEFPEEHVLATVADLHELAEQWPGITRTWQA